MVSTQKWIDYLRFWVLTAVTMKSTVLWVVTPCGSNRTRHTRGAHRLHRTQFAAYSYWFLFAWLAPRSCPRNVRLCLNDTASQSRTLHFALVLVVRCAVNIISLCLFLKGISLYRNRFYIRFICLTCILNSPICFLWPFALLFQFLRQLNARLPEVWGTSCRTRGILWGWILFFPRHPCISLCYSGSCRDSSDRIPT